MARAYEDGSNIGVEIMKWLGIDDKHVRSFTLRCCAREVPTITLECFVETPSGDLEPLTQVYNITPRQDEPTESDPWASKATLPKQGDPFPAPGHKVNFREFT